MANSKSLVPLPTQVYLVSAMQIVVCGAAISGVAADNSVMLGPEQETLCELPQGSGASDQTPQEISAALGDPPNYSWYPDADDHRFIRVVFQLSDATGVVFEFGQGIVVASSGEGRAPGTTFWRNYGIPKDDGYIGFSEPDWDSEACLTVYGCGSTIPWGSSSHCPTVEGCGTTIPWGSAARCPCPPDSAFSAGSPRPTGC